ncbi:hypothetical protein SNK04_013839 [Fusarium graminearum]
MLRILLAQPVSQRPDVSAGIHAFAGGVDDLHLLGIGHLLTHGQPPPAAAPAPAG